MIGTHTKPDIHGEEVFEANGVVFVAHPKEHHSTLSTTAVTGQTDVQTYTEYGTSDRRLDVIKGEMIS